MRNVVRSAAPLIVLLVLLAAVTLLLVSRANRDARNPAAFILPARDEQYAVGQQLYGQHCASCHGANGEGQFPDAPLQPDKTGRYGAPPHNPTGHTWHHPDQVLFKITKDGLIVEGFYPMPGFADRLTDSQITAVLAYIKTWWQPQQLDYQATQTARQAARDDD